MLTLFMGLMLVFVACNAVFLWMMRRRLKRTADAADHWGPKTRAAAADLKDHLERLEAASAKAAELSAGARARVVTAQEHLDRADNRLRYGLATIDYEADRLSERVDGEARRIQGRLAEPLAHTAAGVRSFRGVLAFLDGLLRRFGWMDVDADPAPRSDRARR